MSMSKREQDRLLARMLWRSMRWPEKVRAWLKVTGFLVVGLAAVCLGLAMTGAMIGAMVWSVMAGYRGMVELLTWAWS